MVSKKGKKRGKTDYFAKAFGRDILNGLVKESGHTATKLSREFTADRDWWPGGINPDLLGSYVRGESDPSREFISLFSQWLWGKHLRSKYPSDFEIESKLSFAFGLIPAAIDRLDHQQAANLVRAIEAIVNAVFSSSMDPKQDVGFSNCWVDKFKAQNEAWLALVDFTREWRNKSEWGMIEMLWDRIRRQWPHMHDEQKGWAAILRAQTLKLRGLSHDALSFFGIRPRPISRRIQARGAITNPLYSLSSLCNTW